MTLGQEKRWPLSGFDGKRKPDGGEDKRAKEGEEKMGYVSAQRRN